MIEPTKLKPTSVSAERRKCTSAVLVAPWLAVFAGCGGADDESATTAQTSGFKRVAAVAAAGTTPANPTATVADSTSTTLGNPKVPAVALRNYVFGPSQPIRVTGDANVGVGEAVLRSLTTGFANSALGDQALWQQSDGINCVAIGASAMYSAVSCIDCVAVGVGALQSAQAGVGATAVGRFACSELIVANNNSGFGDSALRRTTTGFANTAVGYRAAESNVVGNENVVIGSLAALNLTGGDRNVVLGFDAMGSATSRIDECVAIGAYSLVNNTGGRNVAVGIGAGRQVTSGTGNVFLGPDTGTSALQKPDVINSVAIGDKAFTTESNQVVIGNNSTDAFVLGGVAFSKAQLIALLALLGPN